MYSTIHQHPNFETGHQDDDEGMIEELKDAFVFEDTGEAQDAARRLLEWFPDASCDVDTESFDEEDAHPAIKDLRAIITGETHELDITIKIGTEAYNFYDAPLLVEGIHKALVDWRDDELCR